MNPHVSPSGKNIVICSDGTGNAYSGTPSNVLRIYTCIEQRSPKQIACYHPGVGTHPLPEGRTVLGRRIRHAKELCVGAGVIATMVSLYAYLMEHYESGDSIFLFGFSRGAFAVRALAGMLHVCGLLRRDDAHLVSFAAGLYQTSEERITRERRTRGLPAKFDPAETTDHASLDIEAGDFKSRVGRPCTVRFMGIWDTVKAYGWLYPQSFPALRHNRGVESVRHAVSLQERRALFKMTGWGDRHDTVKEVWFAGDHSDVGGGHPSGNSPLADASLRWMLGEATHAGLRLDPERRAEVGELDVRSLDAPSSAPHDLWWRNGYWFLDQLPRVELFNAVYPPNRRPRVFWADGERKPSDHTEGAKLRFHWSVEQRAAHDSRLSPERLAGGAAFHIEPDLPILWDE
jgi:uncharacterized protein (DUF2235 family)